MPLISLSISWYFYVVPLSFHQVCIWFSFQPIKQPQHLRLSANLITCTSTCLLMKSHHYLHTASSHFPYPLHGPFHSSGILIFCRFWPPVQFFSQNPDICLKNSEIKGPSGFLDKPMTWYTKQPFAVWFFLEEPTSLSLQLAVTLHPVLLCLTFLHPNFLFRHVRL